MEEKEEDKYLGDVISKDGKNMKNIKARIAKGTGIVNKILTIQVEIHFGKHFTETERSTIRTQSTKASHALVC